jgi:hypothetical protein
MEVLTTLIVLILGLFIYAEIRNKKLLETVTKSNRGTRSERKLVLKLLKYGIPSQAIFHDLYVEKRKRRYAQIDLVVPTSVGVLVFEVKDYSGWIYGNDSPWWTQVLAYGREKHRFYNPIMQNSKHIIDLKKKLSQFEKIPFFSIIVFYGDSVIKDFGHVPYRTFIIKPRSLNKLISDILNNSDPAQYTNKREVVNVLKEAVRNGDSPEIRNMHIAHIMNMFEKLK